MSELPPGWCAVTPLDVAEPVRGVTYKKESVLGGKRKGYTAVLRANNIQDDELVLSDLVFVPDENIQDRQRLKKNDIVIAMSSGSISVVGKSVQIKEEIDASFGAFCGALRPMHEIEPRYLGHFLKSEIYRSAISSMARGVNINNLKWSNFEELELPLAPLPEQKRIADKLDTLLARIDATRERLDRIPVILKRFRQSVLAAATSGRLTEEWRWENRIETQWREEKLGDVVDEMRNGLSPKPSDQPVGVKILRISSVRSGSVDYSDHKYLSIDDREIARYRLVEGDLLFTRYNGSLEFVGVCAVVRKLTEDFVYPDKLIRVRVRKDKVLAAFVEIVFSAPEVRSIIEGFVKSTSGQKGISGGDLRSVLFQLPTIEEQQEIVRRLETLFALVDRLEVRYTTARAQVDKLTPALLAKAFRGELIEQDPSDEPAAVLLERIKAEREIAREQPSAKKKANRKVR